MFSLFAKKKVETTNQDALDAQVKQEIINYFNQIGFDYRVCQIHSVSTEISGKRIIVNVELSYPAIMIGKNGIIIKGIGAYLKSKISNDIHINLVENNPFKGIEEKWR